MSRTRSKPKRLLVEDEAGGDYVARMRAAGPRENESQLSFEIRLAGIERGRQLLIAAIRSTGDVVRAYRQLGIHISNNKTWTRRLGFTPEELRGIPGDCIPVGIPAGR